VLYFSTCLISSVVWLLALLWAAPVLLPTLGILRFKVIGFETLYNSCVQALGGDRDG
jgi:uncharacterized membrane protein